MNKKNILEGILKGLLPYHLVDLYILRVDLHWNLETMEAKRRHYDLWQYDLWLWILTYHLRLIGFMVYYHLVLWSLDKFVQDWGMSNGLTWTLRYGFAHTKTTPYPLNLRRNSGIHTLWDVICGDSGVHVITYALSFWNAAVSGYWLEHYCICFWYDLSFIFVQIKIKGRNQKSSCQIKILSICFEMMVHRLKYSIFIWRSILY